MKKVLLQGGLALAALAAATPGAFAQEGWYARADIGYSFDDSELGLPSPFGSSEFDENYNQSIGVGYALDSGVRIEGEVSHRWNPMEGTITVRNGSDVRAWAGMANVYYDFSRGSIQPYLGVGIGAANVGANVTNPAATSDFDDDSTGFAWQAMAGVAVPLSEQLSFDISYRFFAVPNLEYDGNVGVVPTTFEADYEQSSVMAGLRWTFAAPPPPPPPPPPPAPPPPPPPPPVAAVCPAADFVVYFEWDRSNLNQAALETIDAAVARARQCNLGAVTVTGHTDTSGSAQYNIGLSERRASVVRDALAARGVPAAGITTQARGEADLARATADGIREPLNRRTAVTISFR